MLGDAILVKDGHVVAVELDGIAAIGGYQVHIVVDLFIHFGIIDDNALKVGIEDIPDFSNGSALFLIDEGGGSGLLNLGNGVVPCLEQYLELSV